MPDAAIYHVRRRPRLEDVLAGPAEEPVVASASAQRVISTEPAEDVGAAASQSACPRRAAEDGALVIVSDRAGADARGTRRQSLR